MHQVRISADNCTRYPHPQEGRSGSQVWRHVARQRHDVTDRRAEQLGICRLNVVVITRLSEL